MASQELSPPERAAALAALHILLKRHGGGQNAAARAIGYSQAIVSRAVLQGRIGRGFAEAVATALGTTLRDLVGPCPNRYAAAELCREDGVDEAAIVDVLNEPCPPDGDRSRLWWADRMRLRAAQLARR
jgi:hypothetical protein